VGAGSERGAARFAARGQEVVAVKKGSTYKIALLRVPVRIPDSAAGWSTARPTTARRYPSDWWRLYWSRTFKQLIERGLP